MFEILQKPYPLLVSRRSRIRMSILFSVFTWFFLYIFRPFGVDESQFPMFLVSFSYGMVCFVMMMVLNVFVVPLLPGLFAEQSWTTGHQIFWTMVNIFCIGLGNWVLTAYLFYEPLLLKELINFEVYTLVIGLFPVGISYILNQIWLERKYRLAAANLNEELHPERQDPTSSYSTSSDSKVVIYSDNQDEDMTLDANRLVYAEASDNYVLFKYLNERKQLQKKLIRTSLKKVENDLHAHPQFWRCHKSYIVNRLHVARFSGNAQGYKLHLQTTDEYVPVARSQGAKIREKF